MDEKNPNQPPKIGRHVSANQDATTTLCGLPLRTQESRMWLAFVPSLSNCPECIAKCPEEFRHLQTQDGKTECGLEVDHARVRIAPLAPLLPDCPNCAAAVDHRLKQTVEEAATEANEEMRKALPALTEERIAAAENAGRISPGFAYEARRLLANAPTVAKLELEENERRAAPHTYTPAAFEAELERHANDHKMHGSRAITAVQPATHWMDTPLLAERDTKDREVRELKEECEQLRRVATETAACVQAMRDRAEQWEAEKQAAVKAVCDQCDAEVTDLRAKLEEVAAELAHRTIEREDLRTRLEGAKVHAGHRDTAERRANAALDALAQAQNTIRDMSLARTKLEAEGAAMRKLRATATGVRWWRLADLTPSEIDVMLCLEHDDDLRGVPRPILSAVMSATLAAVRDYLEVSSEDLEALLRPTKAWAEEETATDLEVYKHPSHFGVILRLTEKDGGGL